MWPPGSVPAAAGKLPLRGRGLRSVRREAPHCGPGPRHDGPPACASGAAAVGPSTVDQAATTASRRAAVIPTDAGVSIVLAAGPGTMEPTLYLLPGCPMIWVHFRPPVCSGASLLCQRRREYVVRKAREAKSPSVGEVLNVYAKFSHPAFPYSLAPIRPSRITDRS